VLGGFPAAQVSFNFGDIGFKGRGHGQILLLPTETNIRKCLKSLDFFITKPQRLKDIREKNS
jgi:hypothetical protein